MLNKCKASRVSPLLIADKFVTSCKEKLVHFNNFFVAQCQPHLSTSVLSNFFFLTTAKLDTCEISTESILDMLRSLDANKAHGPYNISVNMIKSCPNALCAPLKLTFDNILVTGIYPDQWKMANVTPVHKKDIKQTVYNYRCISVLPIFAKVFEKYIFKNLYNHLVSNNLISNNHSGFRNGDFVTNQLIYLLHEILKVLTVMKTCK